MLAALTMLAASAPAEARIRCDRGFQIAGDRRLATPYCGDAYLAEVARTYGTKVTAQAIRANPNLKRSVCEFIGQDIRVQHICEHAHPRGPIGGI
ncbi:MAG: hypothetical protein NW205_06305 [Hyphomicrobiaceae bacterium]|nr:hypothetical protein [Hyphomicrobiaceae bacterium]